MKPALRYLAVFILSVTPVALRAADTMADVIKAQVVLGKALQLMTKYAQYSITLEAPTPKPNTKGKYLLPYNETGELTEWAPKTFNVKLGAMAGEKAGGMAGNAVASKVPFGGLASGFMKKKGKEAGAVAALGGQKYITKTSSMSFDDLDDYYRSPTARRQGCSRHWPLPCRSIRNWKTATMWPLTRLINEPCSKESRNPSDLFQ
jgi:hypothetical protein